MPETEPRKPPYAKTRMAQFLEKRIDQLKAEVTQREIATALGYERANLISMFKTGESKVPLDKIPALARALRVDPAHLMKLGLEQYWRDEMKVINEVFANFVTSAEMEIVEIYRSTGADRGVPITEAQRNSLRELFGR